MKQSTTSLGAAVATVSMVFGLAVAPVFALQGEAGQSGASGNAAHGDVQTTNRMSGEPVGRSIAVDDGVGNSGDDKGGLRTAELRIKADRLLQESRSKRGDKTDKTAEQKQKACQLRRALIDRKFVKYNDRASGELKLLDSVNLKVQNFESRRNLSPADYQSLVAAVASAKLAAVDAVAALGTVSSNIDCSASDPAASVAAVKSGVKDSRSALQSYRTSLKKQIQALIVASKQTTTKSTTEVN